MGTVYWRFVFLPPPSLSAGWTPPLKKKKIMSLILSPGPPQAGPLLEAGDWPPVPALPAEGSRLLSPSLPLETLAM